jgi:replicative DNA helicase
MAVLGCILLKPDTCDDVALILRPEDFYDDAHSKLYEHMLKMHDAGRKIDVTLLVDELKRCGDFERLGGAPFLARVTSAVPTAAHATYYAEIIRNDATTRALIDASTEILRDAYAQTHPPKELLNHAEQRIFSILDRRGSAEVSNIRDILHEAMDRIDAWLQGKQITGGVETGFIKLDELTGGLHNSELIILAARPSMGKTALAMNVAEHVAMNLRLPVLFVSLEMSSIELGDRLLCSVAKVDGRQLRVGRVGKEDRKRLVDAANLVSEIPLFVDDSPSRSVTEVAAAARRVARREGRLGLIVIDYLQLVEPDDPKDPRQEQVAKMTRRLKGLAREMKVPVLCLAQLNRQAEISKDNRPRLHHLRESGAIEQDADVVMFVHREEYFASSEDEREQLAGRAEIIVAKQRNGPTGNAELGWHKKYTRFVDLAPQHHEAFDQFNVADY